MKNLIITIAIPLITLITPYIKYHYKIKNGRIKCAASIAYYLYVNHQGDVTDDNLAEIIKGQCKEEFDKIDDKFIARITKEFKLILETNKLRSDI